MNFSDDEDIGSNVLDWPLEGQRGLADGHEICAVRPSFLPRVSATTNTKVWLVAYLVSSLFVVVSSHIAFT